jgi:hypothetical protein
LRALLVSGQKVDVYKSALLGAAQRRLRAICEAACRSLDAEMLNACAGLIAPLVAADPVDALELMEQELAAERRQARDWWAQFSARETGPVETA